MIALAGGNPWVTLAIIYVVTLIVTELITNNAAAALMFPFAMATANGLDVSYMPFVIAVMMAACGRLRHADRLPDQPDGLWPRRLSLQRLREDRRAARHPDLASSPWRWRRWCSRSDVVSRPTHVCCHD